MDKLEKLNKLNIVPEHLNNEIWDLKQKNTIKLIKKWKNAHYLLHFQYF